MEDGRTWVYPAEGFTGRGTVDGRPIRCLSPEVQARVVDPAVEFLAELAGDGPALELGIGTGRIALPLAARGIPVCGIDLSEAMVARLRDKPGGAEIPVAIGDLSATRVDGRFALAYVVFNTIMNLRAQEAQLACFENVAAHLEPGAAAL